MRPITAILLYHLRLGSLGRVVGGDTLGDLVSVMDASGHSWCIIGGIAVVVHGYDRTTDDIDILADASPQEMERLKMIASAEWKVKLSSSKKMLWLTHRKTGSLVEVLSTHTNEQKEKKVAVKRASKESILGTSIPVLRVEDLIVLKIMVALRNPSRAGKDWGDVNGLLGTMSNVRDMDKVSEYVLGAIPNDGIEDFQDYVKINRRRLLRG